MPRLDFDWETVAVRGGIGRVLAVVIALASCRGVVAAPVVVPPEIARLLHCPAGTTTNSEAGSEHGRSRTFPMTWCARNDGTRHGMAISWDDRDPTTHSEQEFRDGVQTGIERTFERGHLVSAMDVPRDRGLAAWFSPDGHVTVLDEQPHDRAGTWRLQLGRVEEPIEAHKAQDSSDNAADALRQFAEEQEHRVATCHFESSQSHSEVSDLIGTDGDGKLDGLETWWSADRAHKWAQGRLGHGQRQGPWTYFDSCGQQVFALTYEHDRLVAFDGKPIPR